MLRNLFLALGAVLLLSTTATAQRNCGAEELLHQQMDQDPIFREARELIERQTREFVLSGGVHDRVQVTIPVVVHVLWNTTAQNISQAQIQSQIDVLNADFRKLNADVAGVPSVFQGLTADMEINFCLATQDNGGAATTGVERRQTTNTSWAYTNNNMKFFANGGLDAWNRDKYLNIWVCNLSGGILGFATFPGGAANVDGVVITTTAFGTNGTAAAPFNKGRTGTHEVGHWLNLYHIWGDDGTSCTGTDQVSDTPNQADENYGCPTFPQVSCSNGPNGDMFMNYMDYTDDACMFMFSAGQKTRSQALFASGGARFALLSSPGCQPPSTSCGTPSGLSAGSITQTGATLSWGAVSGANTYNLQWKLGSSSTWTTVSGLTGTSYALSGLTANTAYNYQVQAVCSAGSSSYSAAASFTTQSAGGCTDIYEANETRQTAKAITPGTAITAKIGTATDKDYFKFSNTTANRNVKVTLTNLPLDYDLKLYRGASLVGTSDNGGTASEQLIYNNTQAVATYTAYVYGYNGAFNNSSCYTLLASLSSSNFVRSDGSTDGQVVEIEIPVVFENAGFGLFPNPASQQVTVEVPMENEADVTVSIMDPAGKVAAQQHRTLSKGDNQVLFDVSNMSNGIYFVQVRNGETTLTRKLVKSE